MARFAWFKRAAAAPAPAASSAAPATSSAAPAASSAAPATNAANDVAEPEEIAIVEITARLVSVASPGSIKIPTPHAAAAAIPTPTTQATTPAASAVYDSRRTVASLLKEHEASVAAVRAVVEKDALYDPSKHDALWLLRYVMSHKGNVESSAAAAIATMHFRQRWNLDADNYDTSELASAAVLKFYNCLTPGAITYYVPDPDRAVILVGRVRDLNFHQLAATMTPEETAMAGRLSSEYLHRYSDEVTRRTGRLTKYVRCIDLRGVKLSGMSREFQRRDRELAKAIEDFYPQLLDSVYLCHAPGWVQGVWRWMRPLLPERFVEKVDFVAPATSAVERQRLIRKSGCPEELLPACFGGGCEEWPLPNARFDERKLRELEQACDLT